MEARAIGKSVRVFWEGDQVWYEGVIDDFHPSRGYHVQYFDGEDEWLSDLDQHVEILDDDVHNHDHSQSSAHHDDVDMGVGEGEELDFAGLDDELELNILDYPRAISPSSRERQRERGREREEGKSSSMSPLRATADTAAMNMNNKSVKRVTIAEEPRWATERETERETERDSEVTLSSLTEKEQQERHRETVNAQAALLHANGVLLVGSVSRISLFLSDSSAQTSSFLFKVLFVEGGSQPAMFRCKTPVFTSANASAVTPKPLTSVQEELQLRWRENTFRCDMIMPADGDGSFLITGEVLLSVYRARSNGGQDLVGQTAFDLAQLSRGGEEERFRESTVGRSLRGIFSLLRGSTVTGEVEMQLFIAWRERESDRNGNDKEKKPVSSSSEKEKDKQKTATTAVRPKTAAVKVGSGQTTVQRAKSPSAQRPASAARTTAGVAAATTTTGIKSHAPHPPRKIVSKLAKQQRENAMRIERENRILMQKIQRHGVSASAVYSSSAAEAKTAVAQLQTTPTLGQQYAAEAKETRRTMEEKRKKASDDKTSKTNNERVSAMDVESLHRLYVQLKKSLAEDEEEIKNLVAKRNNLAIHIKRFSAHIERCKQIPGSTARLSAKGERVPTNSTRSNNNNSPLDTMDAAQPKQLISPRVDVDNTYKKTDQFRIVENNYPDCKEADAEYRSFKEEYDVLQNMRRGLLERIHQAKLICGSVDVETTFLDMKQKMLTSRLLHFDTEFSPFFASEELKSEMKSLSKEMNEDVAIYSQHRALRDELIALEITQTDTAEHCHLMSAREELLSVLASLKARRDSLQDEVNTLREKKEDSLRKVKHSIEESVQFKLRDRITTMRALELQARIAERQNPIVERLKECETELLRLKLIAREREKLGSS